MIPSNYGHKQVESKQLRNWSKYILPQGHPLDWTDAGSGVETSFWPGPSGN